MDERIFSFKSGVPIPEWDLQHRLPLHKPVGPECKDGATIFRVNSTFMDVTDQPYLQRQWTAAAVLTACSGAAGALITAKLIYSHPHGNIDTEEISFLILILSVVMVFCFAAYKTGRDEFFALTRRPIRLNRRDQKIYAIRRRRFFARPGEGDLTWEAPWSADSIFCIHKGVGAMGESYHIRHYTVDDKGDVVRAFSIGREWQGKGNMQSLLSQWNYWAEYMNHGPEELPQPPLFFSERETTRESFLFCLYELDPAGGSLFRIIFMPIILLWTFFRVLAQWTCRDPVWPSTVERASEIAPDDPYDQPRGDTPVGWGETVLATARDEWPNDPKKSVKQWRGENDQRANGLLWAADVPPKLR